jgi:hypothetical protein
MNKTWYWLPLGLGVAHGAWTKPIAYADSTTFMAEWDRSGYEVQAFYAPSARLSFGPSLTRLAVDGRGDGYGYVRVNGLARRWNLRGAQGNAFYWGGVGIHTGDAGRGSTAYNVGGQLDYETLHLFSMLRHDRHHARALDHAITTAQFGLSPYTHRTDGWALWGVLQAKVHHGDRRARTETAALIRVFKRRFWFEFGWTDAGRPTAMLMWVQ